MKIEEKLQGYRRTASSLGLFPAIAFKLQKLRGEFAGHRHPYTLFSKHSKYPLKCRPGTSDLDVFGQIFVVREYRCLDDVHVGAGLIIDCGGNVGYSSAYFLSRFPEAKILVVEPDEENFRVLAENLAPYGDRCGAFCNAVWSHKTGLVIAESTFGDGKEWSRQVRATRPGESPAMHALDIGGLLKASGFARISILKIDIEGGEAAVFSANYEDWIGKVDNLVIELHGTDCEAAFFRAIVGRGFDVSRCDELTVCKRKS
ncbi:MAG: FkbM family methyltransferase [Betaproteobacteria bacterium]